MKPRGNGSEVIKKRRISDPTDGNEEDVSEGSVKHPVTPSAKVLFGGGKAWTRRGNTNLGAEQGDHVTAYAVVDKAIKNCVEKMLQASELEEQKKAEEREKFLKILCGVIGVLCEDDEVRQAQIVGEIRELIDVYEKERAELYTAREWLESKDCSLDRSSETFETFTKSLGDRKSVIHEKMLKGISEAVLTNFNFILGLSFPKHENYRPPATEPADVKKAVNFFVALGNAAEAAAGASAESLSRSGRSGRGNFYKASKEKEEKGEIFEHVKNLFFYPRYKEEDLPECDDESMTVRNNSQKLLEKFVARHLFLVTLSYPVLKESESEICDNFCVSIATDWGISKTKELDQFRKNVKTNLEALAEKLDGETLAISPSPAKVTYAATARDEGLGAGGGAREAFGAIPRPSSQSSSAASFLGSSGTFADYFEEHNPEKSSPCHSHSGLSNFPCTTTSTGSFASVGIAFEAVVKLANDKGGSKIN